MLWQRQWQWRIKGNGTINDTVTVAAGSQGSNNADNSATVTNNGTINGPITFEAGTGDNHNPTNQTNESLTVTNDGTIG